MAQAPNNPFDTPPNQHPHQTSSSGSNTLLWVLGIVGGLFLLSAVVCCGGMTFLGYKAQEMVGEAVKEQFQDDPMIVEHIGELESASMDFNATAKESSKNNDESVVVFNVKGDKGEGRVFQRTNPRTGAQTMTLITDDGQEYEMEAFGGFDEEFEMETEELESELESAEQTEMPESGEVDLNTGSVAPELSTELAPSEHDVVVGLLSIANARLSYTVCRFNRSAQR